MSNLTECGHTNLLKIDELNPKRIISYQQLENKIGFFNPFSISKIFRWNELYVIVNIDDTKLVLVNENFEKIGLLKKEGRGPGEFLELSSVFLTKKNLYVFDAANSRLSIFDKSLSFLNSNLLPISMPTSYSSFYITEQNFLFYSGINIKDGIKKYQINSNDSQITTFGTETLIEHEWEENINTTSRYLFQKDSKIISLYSNKPYIEIYNSEGKLLSTYDLTKINVLDGLWERYRNKNISYDGKNHILFNDAKFVDNSLYILCSGWDGKKDNAAHIISIDINNEIKDTQTIKLYGKQNDNDPLITRIALNRTTLTGYSSISGNIYIYDIKKENE